MTPQGHLGLTLSATVLAATAILLVNSHIDPFALRIADRQALTAGDRTPTEQEFWHKALGVTYIRPATVILGTSRADRALDSAHPGFADDARPVYNLALAGVSIDQIRQLLVHAQSTRPLHMAVITLDLEAFLPGGRTDFDMALLAGNADSAPEWMNRLRLTLSWRTLAASMGRLKAAQDTSAGEEGPVGARETFQIAEFNNFYSRVAQLFPRWEPGFKWNTEPQRAASMRAFSNLLAYARREGIELRLFISPVHARYLELYRRAGWWPLFESWKRELVAVIAADAAQRPGQRAFLLWDFSGYNAITTEALPPAEDLTTQVRWYGDSSHYSRAHGDLILDRVLQHFQQREEIPAAIGVLIGPQNIETHLQRVRLDADDYRHTHRADAAEAALTIQYLARFVRRRP